jgi:hypothetical protein
MRSRWFSTLIACALLAGTASVDAVPIVQSHVNATPALPDFDACLSRLDPELDIGYERIAAHCPELVKQLDHGAWAPWMPRQWKEPGNDLSAGSLKEFRDLAKRETAASISGRSPDVGALHAVLTGLETRKPAGGWSRFKSWLRSVLEARDQAPAESWFSRMVAHVGVPQSLRQLIAYAALTVVVVLAAVIVFNELRAAGLLRQGRAHVRRRRAAGPAQASGSGQLWSDIEHAPLLDKPRLLLGLIVRRLAELGYLPPAGALTARELIRVARLPEPGARMQLEEVASAAEQVRYGAREPEATALEGSIASGRELLNRLNASGPQ